MTARATEAAQALRPALPDTLRPIFDSVVTEFQGAIVGLERSLARADSILTLRERELGALRAQNAQLVTALARTEGLMEGWRRKAEPGLFTQIRRGLPFLAAGVLVGVLVSQ